MYRFSFDSPIYNLKRIRHAGPDVRGASHGDELSYLYFMDLSFKIAKNTMEYRTIEKMLDIWTSFAANSNPNCASTKLSKWLPLDKTGPIKCLNIDKELKFIELPENEKLEIWTKLFEEANLL